MPEQVRKCVLFIGTKEKGQFVPKATAFIVSIRDGDLGHRFIVTADHVIAYLKSRNLEIWVRSNRKDGTAQEDNWSTAHWWFHPDVGSTDVAIASINFNSDEDFRSVPLSDGEPPVISMAGTTDVLKQHWVNVGHEVYITGLFRSHYGYQRNVPIIRTGNIAMMLGEKVRTKHCGYTDAYLIEARSISGLSGSPVFVEMNSWANGSIVGHKTVLLGLMHGHFDVTNLNEDVVIDADGNGSINTGIGVVILVEKILETIYQPEVTAMRKEAAKKFREARGASADVDDSKQSRDENPNAKEDFMRLANAAARKQPQGE